MRAGAVAPPGGAAVTPGRGVGGGRGVHSCSRLGCTFGTAQKHGRPGIRTLQRCIATPYSQQSFWCPPRQ